MPKKIAKSTTKRRYRSPTRQLKSEETRERILNAAFDLLREKRYERMTIDGIAERAQVSSQTVYVMFHSKAGILSELIDRISFGPEYKDLVSKAMEREHPADRLRYVAKIARHIFDQRSEVVDILRGASLVSPELADLIEKREQQRYANQEHVIAFLNQEGCLRQDLNFKLARDLLWTLTSRELYSLMVQQRGWSSAQYEAWLGEALVEQLLQGL